MVMETFHIPCHSSSPITWVTISEFEHVIDSDLIVSHTVNDSSRFQYVATLTFPSVGVTDVKFYYCVQNRSLDLAEDERDLENEVNNFRATKVYLFVEGIYFISTFLQKN